MCSTAVSRCWRLVQNQGHLFDEVEPVPPPVTWFTMSGIFIGHGVDINNLLFSPQHCIRHQSHMYTRCTARALKNHYF